MRLRSATPPGHHHCENDFIGKDYRFEKRPKEPEAAVEPACHDALNAVLKTAGVTLMIFILFEYVLDIELYRGVIYTIWAGDADC